MLTRVLATALVAGFAAGIVVAVLQHFTTTPLILAAEAYESQAAAGDMFQPAAAAAGEARLIYVHAGHDEAAGDAGWSPQAGIERTLYTSTVTVATAIGFASLLVAGLLFAGGEIDPRRALALSVAGFAVTGLAPALGLPPELPGMIAADLLERQVWWIGTAVATALALWLLLSGKSTALKALGLVILIAPHVIGAPHPVEGDASRVPAELAARFASTSLVIHAVLWVLTGACVGWVWQLQSRSRPAEAS